MLRADVLDLFRDFLNFQHNFSHTQPKILKFGELLDTSILDKKIKFQSLS